MRNIRIYLTILIALLVAGSLRAQETPLTNGNSGNTFDVGQGAVNLTDDGGLGGNYAAGQDVYCIITGECRNPDVLRLSLRSFDIAATDTLIIYNGIYNGTTNNVPIAAKINNSMPPTEVYFYPIALNTSGCMTVRFKTAANSEGGAGFVLGAQCALPCVPLESYFVDRYFKARNGVIYDSTFVMGERIQKDTIWQFDLIVVGDSSYNDTTGYEIMETPFWGLEICEGDSLIIEGHGNYGTGGTYNPTDNTSTFHWDWGDGDTLTLTGAMGGKFGGHSYRDVGCYDVSLVIEDFIGCRSAFRAEVRVRIALMPLKTLFDLQTMCNTDSLLVNVGYGGEGAFLTLKKIEFTKTATKSYPVRTFIPDGKNCPSECFEAPVTFTEFPSGRTITSKEDICSICLNYEHSFMGDYTSSIVCPNGNEAILKFGSYDNRKPSRDEDGRTKSYNYGSGTYTGWPDDWWDGSTTRQSQHDPSMTECCDSVYNPFGDGLEYCWSRNGAYTLVTGELCNSDPSDGVIPDPNSTSNTPTYIYIDVNHYIEDRHINGTNYVINETHTFSPVPAYFYSHAGETQHDSHMSTKKPSNHEAKTDYYLPDADFSSLVGCPLNGEWSMRVCDQWGADNGWIFSWSMDLCGISSGGCEYQVGIDSVTWKPDTLDGDFDLGHWRGVTLWPRDSVRTWVASPDTAGTFRVLINIYDEFGCVWDTATRITTVWNPMPNLPDTINLCGVETYILDATDPHTHLSNQTYCWEPFGDSTATIETRPIGSGTGSQLYTVQVTNTQHNIRCNNRDSVRVSFFKTPIATIDPGVYPMEGCEPFTIRFQNLSQNGAQHFWDFGDGYTSEAESPIHSYATGQYDLKYYITSADGCKDSLIFPQTVTVFPAPIAKFSWEPINPTVLHPQVTFTNKTEPQTDDVKFYWEVQYDKNNPLSYHTMRELNPTFEWETNGEDISGPYIARLIAKTDQRGPSGHVLECRDTVENTILLVNDFLQFPNVITANGDGVNDVFEVKNLVNGMGYPNNSLSIYNRWGKCVYHKTNIASEEDFWDPAKENIPAGTYYWRFSGKGYLGDIERNGVVEVLR